MNPVNALSFIFNKLFIYDKWNIGYVYQTPESLIQSGKLNGNINWLREDKVDYAADPFGIEINGRTHIFYEELNLWKGRGEIMMLDSLNFKNKKKVCGIIKQPLHISYPYIFTAEDRFYCIPETSAAKQIALYQVNKEQPQKLKKIKVLITGSAFVDSSMIYFEGMYWLFTSISGKQGKLYVFYSDTLIGAFKAHAQNPIAVAPEVSRSAGRLFIVNEKLYMPSQNPEKCYGGSIIMNEITRLSENEFQYRTTFEILPQLPYNEGLHTINFTGGLLIVDGKRRVFSILNPFKKVIMKIRNRHKNLLNNG
jgi:hypothetical protein